MTVTSQTSKTQYNGNGSTTVFSTVFAFINDSDVTVILTDADGLETTQVLSSDYTLTGAGTGAAGSVTMTIAPVSGEILTIFRDPPITQETDYIEGDSFPAETHELALDKLTHIAQRLNDIISRTLKLQESSTASTTLPAPIADKLLGWNSAATALVNIEPTDASTQAVTASGTTVSRLLANRFAEVNNVVDNGAVGDGVTDDTAAFQTTVNKQGIVYVPAGDYKIVGEVIIGSETILMVDMGVTFTMDCSGENGRGFYFRHAVNSGIVGSFIINASATSAGSGGSRNSCIQIGCDFGTDAVAITQHFFTVGVIDIRITGSINIKGFYGSGWCEDIYLDTFLITGQTNFAFTFHWSGDTAVGILPTKTWHADRIYINHVRVYQKSGFVKPQRGITTSAAGRVFINSAYCNTLSQDFNFFVGDFGETYAQNVQLRDFAQFFVNNLTGEGDDGILSCDQLSSGYLGSPVFSATTYGTLIGRNLDFKAATSSDGLTIGVTALRTLDLDINYVNPNTATTREWIKVDTCTDVWLRGHSYDQRNARFVSCRRVNILSTMSRRTSTISTNGIYQITAESCENIDLMNAAFELTDNVITCSGAKTLLRVMGCTFDSIGNTVMQNNATTAHNIICFNHFDTVAQSTASNLETIVLDGCNSAIIMGNFFDTNDARYHITTDSNSSNVRVIGNIFADVNNETNSAAVFVDDSSTDVYVDADSNVKLGTKPLVHPTFPADSEISSGTATLRYKAKLYPLDTESDAATDDLHTITLSEVSYGEIITVFQASDSRDITYKNGTGNLRLNGAVDYTPGSQESRLTLQWNGTEWFEISRMSY